MRTVQLLLLQFKLMTKFMVVIRERTLLTSTQEGGGGLQKLTKGNKLLFVSIGKSWKKLTRGEGGGLKNARFWLTSIKYVP